MSPTKTAAKKSPSKEKHARKPNKPHNRKVKAGKPRAVRHARKTKKPEKKKAQIRKPSKAKIKSPAGKRAQKIRARHTKRVVSPKKTRGAPGKRRPAGKANAGKRKTGKTARGAPSKSILSANILTIAKPMEVLFESEPLERLMPILEKNGCVYVSKKYQITGRVVLSGVIDAIMKKDGATLTAGQIKLPVVAIEKSRSIKSAFETMKKNNVDTLIVKSKDDIVGCVDMKDIFNYASKKASAKDMPKGSTIETNIDKFISMLKKDPVSYSEVEKKFGMKKDQIDEWIDVLEKENILKVEKHFGKLKIKTSKK